MRPIQAKFLLILFNVGCQIKEFLYVFLNHFLGVAFLRLHLLPFFLLLLFLLFHVLLLFLDLLQPCYKALGCLLFELALSRDANSVALLQY